MKKTVGKPASKDEENKLVIDPTKDQLVILSPRRSSRPKLFGQKEQKPACPFCPGNERMTPPTKFALPSIKGWKTRVFENAFPALTPKGKFSGVPGNAYGEHLVMVETPEDTKLFQDYSPAQLSLVFKTYLKAYATLERMKGIKRVFIFKNHGLAGGASIPHEHSQAFAFPFNPPTLVQEDAFSMVYKMRTGKCYYCDFAKRHPVLWENDFAAVVPVEFARFAYELWVIPKKHVARLKDLAPAQGVKLLQAVQECVRKTYGIVDSYNFVIHETGHLHVEFYPRKSVWAGLELGAGIVINSRSPENVIGQLR